MSIIYRCGSVTLAGMAIEISAQTRPHTTVNRANFISWHMSYTETIEKQSTIRKLAPNYRVLLHNDEFNAMEHVVEVLVTSIPISRHPKPSIL